MNTRVSILATLCFVLAQAAGFAQDVELDGPQHVFQDTLLDNMVGKWNVTGKVAGHNAEQTVQAEWVLNHQFLRIHEKQDSAPEPGDGPYEAIVMVGYDNASERYVAHWMDVFGGRFSETLGYGSRQGDEIRFVFEYPDGPFHTTFRWKPDLKQWQWVMRTRNNTGQWVEFADMTLARSKNP
jgi:hypothetical protein